MPRLHSHELLHCRSHNEFQNFAPSGDGTFGHWLTSDHLRHLHPNQFPEAQFYLQSSLSEATESTGDAFNPHGRERTDPPSDHRSVGNYFKPPLDLLPQHNAKLTSSVTAAVELAVAECRHQFRFDAWNCPEVAFGEGGDDGGADYGTGDLRSDLTLIFSAVSGLCMTLDLNISSAFEKTQSRRKRREQLEGLSKALLNMPSVVGADYKIRMTLDDDNGADRKDRDGSKRRKKSGARELAAAERAPRKLDLEDEKFMAERKEGSRARAKGRRGRHANSSARQR